MAQTSITIRTDPELGARVAALATAMDRSRNWIIEEAIRQYVEAQAWQVAGIKDAIASLDRGDAIDHDEVMAEMDALLTRQGGKD
jgi:predicted transcriptional regulator